jgi:hypothetical protein
MKESRDISVCMVMDQVRFPAWRREQRPNRFWSPPQPPIQWVPGALSPVLKRQGHENDKLHTVPRLRMVEVYINFPLRLHGVVLNWLKTGTILSLYVLIRTPRRCRGKAVDMYSRRARFECRPRHRLSWIKFLVIFLSSSRQTPG